LTLFLIAEFVRPGGGTGDWKVASTGRQESLPYVGIGALPEPAFKDRGKMRLRDTAGGRGGLRRKGAPGFWRRNRRLAAKKKALLAERLDEVK